jgi:hypothetical protein
MQKKNVTLNVKNASLITFYILEVCPSRASRQMACHPKLRRSICAAFQVVVIGLKNEKSLSFLIPIL